MKYLILPVELVYSQAADALDEEDPRDFEQHPEPEELAVALVCSESSARILAEQQAFISVLAERHRWRRLVVELDGTVVARVIRRTATIDEVLEGGVEYVVDMDFDDRIEQPDDMLLNWQLETRPPLKPLWCPSLLLLYSRPTLRFSTPAFSATQLQ